MPQRKPARHLRLVVDNERTTPTPTTMEGAHALHYTSRSGTSWFLHQGATKTGRPKYYVAKSIGPGAIPAMPAGFEFSESVNGVVSVRRVNNRPKPVDDADVELVLREVARHTHLRYYRVAAGRTEIVIHEPVGALSDSGFQRLASMLGHLRSLPESHLSEIRGRARYTPVLKFVAETAVRAPGVPSGPSEPRTYSVRRMTYRGDGGWSYPLADGPLHNLVRDFVWRIGTDRFFDL